MRRQKIKLCFVSLNSYHYLLEKNPTYAGGAEVQQVELAKELKKRGYEISFITYGKNKNDAKHVDGIKIVPAYSLQDVNKISFVKKMMCIWNKMKKINADVYIYQAGTPGIVTLFGFFNNKKIINLLASDADVTGEVIIKEGSVGQWIGTLSNWFDIKFSDIVISQNTFQKSRLKNKFKVDSYLIKNAFNLTNFCNGYKKDEYVLWVGMIRDVKQPSIFLEIAKSLPNYKFVMIGGIAESKELFEKIKNDADKIPNLDFKGFVPHNKIFDYYKKASLLVNTSKTEGFPNIFIESWVHNLPVVSLNVDPDKIITKNKLGYCSKSFKHMIKDITSLLENKKLRQMMAENGRKYIKNNHDVEKIAGKYEDLCASLLKNKRTTENA